MPNGYGTLLRSGTAAADTMIRPSVDTKNPANEMPAQMAVFGLVLGSRPASTVPWGLCPQTPGIYRFMARMASGELLVRPGNADTARLCINSQRCMAGFRVSLYGRIGGVHRGTVR